MDEKRFEDFMKRTEDDISYIRSKVDRLWDFRLLLIGGSMAISAITGGIMSLLIVYIDARK